MFREKHIKDVLEKYRELYSSISILESSDDEEFREDLHARIEETAREFHLSVVKLARNKIT
ncbi:hypothetical protein [Saccharophagus degradans]|uniref:Uncharacterized protein n=1 Tax=Saccharophagus degradans TaxID=86304 RepID=A0AAW7X370_9GAMM|nr:hypothetical protein [Saccharophagus degradans]MDO6420844.1 hypothetical protein [Saccharophagus degradans]MDO6609797.1 hypothetical protein [Saccharophagus degradans]